MFYLWACGSFDFVVADEVELVEDGSVATNHGVVEGLKELSLIIGDGHANVEEAAASSHVSVVAVLGRKSQRL